MVGLREFLGGKGGKAIAAALVVVAVGLLIWNFKNSFGSGADVTAANTRIFIDSQSGKPFTVQMASGMTVPIQAPSGNKSGFPAELCWWTKDGKVRSQPYPVLLNSWVGNAEPTFCPDCGRLVVPHNPAPVGADATPPPTQSEYKGSGANSGRDR